MGDTPDNIVPITRDVRTAAEKFGAEHDRELLTILFTAAAALWGYRSLLNSPLDAIPDLSDVQVIVFTEWPGSSPDLVEDQITYPLTTTLLAAPKVKFVRGQSFMGLSFVYAIFEDGTDMYWARSRVLEEDVHKIRTTSYKCQTTERPQKACSLMPLV